VEAPAEHDFGLKAHRNVSCNGMSTNCLRHFTVHRQALAEHDFVLQQAIPVVEQMDAQLAERNPALQAPLARKKCALNAHFISKAHRNVPCNGMSTNCLRHFMCSLSSLRQSSAYCAQQLHFSPYTTYCSATPSIQMPLARCR
jgi:hypothetical protein